MTRSPRAIARTREPFRSNEPSTSWTSRFEMVTSTASSYAYSKMLAFGSGLGSAAREPLRAGCDAPARSRLVGLRAFVLRREPRRAPAKSRLRWARYPLLRPGRPVSRGAPTHRETREDRLRP